MTEQPPVPAPTFAVVYRKGSRLEQLHAAYAEAKANADSATKTLKAVTDGIKVEMSKQAPEGAATIDLPAGAGPAMHLTYVESWRVDAKKLKAESPETYVRFAKKSGAWRLSEAKAGESE